MDIFKKFLYISATLLIGIPTFIVLATDTPFSESFSQIVVGLALLSVILGKLITLFQKRKSGQSYRNDFFIILGLMIVWIIDVINSFIL